MADPLSIAASIAGLLALCGKIISEGYTFANSVHNCPKELPLYLQEISLLSAVFAQFTALASANTQPASALQQVVASSATTDCEQLLKVVENTVKQCQQIQRQRGNNLRKALIWPFKERETKETLERLRHFRDHFGVALSVDAWCVLQDLWGVNCWLISFILVTHYRDLRSGQWRSLITNKVCHSCKFPMKRLGVSVWPLLDAKQRKLSFEMKASQHQQKVDNLLQGTLYEDLKCRDLCL